jgi:hypothetical protein
VDQPFHAQQLQGLAVVPSLLSGTDPLCGPEIPKIPSQRFQKLGGFTPDDDRLNAAVSRAGIGPTVGVGCTSAVARFTD